VRRTNQDGWAEYNRMDTAERVAMREELSVLRNPPLMQLWFEEANYVARDVLLTRGMLEEGAAAGYDGLCVCAHVILVEYAGATRVRSVTFESQWRTRAPGDRSRDGVVFPQLRHYDVRARRVTDPAKQFVSLTPRDKIRFPDVAVVLFDAEYELMSAWKIASSVVDQHRTGRGLPITSGWQQNIEVERINVAPEWARHGVPRSGGPATT
jgi:hypothetical protein